MLTMDRTQRQQEPTTGVAGGERRMPGVLVWVARGLAVLVALHLVVPLVMVLERGALAAAMRAANPALTAQELRYGVAVTLGVSALYHLLFAGLYTWLARRLRSGRPWVRAALTAVLAVATLTSAVSFASSALFRAIIPPTDLLQLVLIGLLWLPRPARSFFAARA